MATVTKTAGTIVSSTGWTNFTTSQVGTSDDSRATTASATYVAGIMRNFNFAVPGDESTIDGITISFEFSTSNAAGTAYVKCRYSVNAGTGWSNYGTERTNATTTDGTQVNGGTADLMGLTPTLAQVNDNTNFYVSLEGHNNGTRTCRVDYVTVTINYTAKYRLTCAVTDWAIAGVSANMSKGGIMTASVTDWQVVMQDLISLKVARLLSESVSDWAIVGQDLTALKAARLLTTASTDSSIAFIDAGLKVNRLLTASVTDWAVTGIDASIKVDKLIVAVVTNWETAGIEADLRYGRILDTAVIDTTLTGYNIELNYNHAIYKFIICEATDILIDCIPCDIKAFRLIPAGFIDWVITGRDTTIISDRKIVAEQSTLSITPFDVLITITYSSHDYVEICETVNFEITGNDVQFNFNFQRLTILDSSVLPDAEIGVLSTQNYDAALTITSNNEGNASLQMIADSDRTGIITIDASQPDKIL